jgi:hypothetical protein
MDHAAYYERKTVLHQQSAEGCSRGAGMFRNSNLYRRWWYVKRRNINRIRLLVRLLIAMLIMSAILLFAELGIFDCLLLP